MKALLKFLLVINILLFISLMFFWIIPSIHMYREDQSKAEDCGMRPFIKKRPFTIFVDKDFPHNQSVSIGNSINSIVYRCVQEDTHEEAFIAQVCVGFNTDVSISFSGRQNPKISKVTLFHDGVFYEDLNLDGMYDKKFSIKGSNLVERSSGVPGVITSDVKSELK